MRIVSLNPHGLTALLECLECKGDGLVTHYPGTGNHICDACRGAGRYLIRSKSRQPELRVVPDRGPDCAACGWPILDCTCRSA